MFQRLIIILTYIACACGAGAQSIAESELLNQNPTRSGVSTHLAFELTTPTGSHGRWTTGGGATLSVAYTHYFTPRWFISPAVAAFYSTMGTDFIPDYDHVYEGTLKNYGARIPVHVGYRMQLPYDFSLSVATGPQLNVSIYAKEHPSPDFEAPDIEPDPINLFGRGFHRLDMQWGFFAGLTYKDHYCLGLSGGIGLRPAASMSHAGRKLDIRRNSVAFMLIYKF